VERTFGISVQLGFNNLGFRVRIHTAKINLRNLIHLVQRRVVHIFVYFPASISVSISRHIHTTSVSIGVLTLRIGVYCLLENQIKKLTKTGCRGGE